MQEDCLSCKRPGFNSWVGKIFWRRKWQPRQYCYPGSPIDRGAWWAMADGIARVGHDLWLMTPLPQQDIQPWWNKIQYRVCIWIPQWSQVILHSCLASFSDPVTSHVSTVIDLVGAPPMSWDHSVSSGQLATASLCRIPTSLISPDWLWITASHWTAFLVLRFYTFMSHVKAETLLACWWFSEWRRE